MLRYDCVNENESSRSFSPPMRLHLHHYYCCTTTTGYGASLATGTKERVRDLSFVEYRNDRGEDLSAVRAPSLGQRVPAGVLTGDNPATIIRQVTKLALSSSIVEQQNDDKPNFTTAELRDLFTLRLDTTSDTHDLLGCRCSATAVRIPVHLRSSSVSVSSLMKYDHCDDMTKCEVGVQQPPPPTPLQPRIRRTHAHRFQDPVLANLDTNVVSFMLSSRTEAPPEPEATADGDGDEVQVEETAAEAFVNAPVGSSASSSSSSSSADDEDE